MDREGNAVMPSIHGVDMDTSATVDMGWMPHEWKEGPSMKQWLYRPGKAAPLEQKPPCQTLSGVLGNTWAHEEYKFIFLF